MLRNWKQIMVSFISLVMIAVVFPNDILAAEYESLDDSFTDFIRGYQKQEAEGIRLSSFKEESAIHDRRILVKVEEDTTLKFDSLDVVLVKDMHQLKREHIYVVKVPEKVDYHQKLQEIKETENVVYAEPDYLLEDVAIERPSDPYFQKQWYLDKIDLLHAWEINRGSEDVKVAVIDSGVDARHPDLEGRVLQGYDYINGKKGGHGDDHGHGTHVAGIISANANGKGIVGIDQAAKIVPIKAMNQKGTGSLANAIDAIYYAMESGAQIINMSYVIDEYSEIEEDALWEAYEKGILLVAAAGNNESEDRVYPGSYRQVINVSATNQDDKLADFSNYGSWIDMAAPGVNIYSTNNLGGYTVDNGTSFSAPIVTAIASLVKAEHPDWSPEEIRWALESGADNLGSYEWDHLFGFGRANAYNSLSAELPAVDNDAGNESKSARKVDSGQLVKEKMELPLDVDWFTFDLNKKSAVTIDLMNKSIHADLVGVLYRKESGEIKQQHVVDDLGMGEDEQLQLNLSKGTYYLAVSEYFGRWSEDGYHMQVDYDKDVASKQPFSDVTIYQDEIEFLTKAKIINGFPNGTFKPNADVTRIQAVRMILKEMGIDVAAYQAPDPGFRDVRRDSDIYKQVAIATDLGFIKGRDDGTFDPSGSITRAHMAAILARAYHIEGTSNIEFTDVKPGHWAYAAIQALVANKIANGYPNHKFKPYQPLTRQQFSLLLYNKIQMDN